MAEGNSAMMPSARERTATTPPEAFHVAVVSPFPAAPRRPGQSG
jgi:hypothetical protein